MLEIAGGILLAALVIAAVMALMPFMGIILRLGAGLACALFVVAGVIAILAG